jgi:hypothetical protein
VLEMPRGGEHVGGNWRLHRREERLLELRKNRKGVLLEWRDKKPHFERVLIEKL